MALILSWMSQEKNPSKKARAEPDPKPGTSNDPPLPSLDPDPTPAADPKKVTWPSEPEYWAKSTLPTNHSK